MYVVRTGARLNSAIELKTNGAMSRIMRDFYREELWIKYGLSPNILQF